MRMRRIILGSLPLIAAGPANASETITYTYDALGRLTANVASGGPSSGANTAIQYDPAGNRTTYQTSGSPNPTNRGVVVVPLNGFTIIPLPPIEAPF